MKPIRVRRRAPRRSPENGYAYFMAFFMITVLLVTSQAVLRKVAVEGQRERETEMVWRGNQYVRALRMYYHKVGRYPKEMDDLTKGVPGLHFLRAAALKDPMNKTDGSWRLIYTNASGQIIGSTRYATMQQMALLDLTNGKLPQTGQGGSSGSSGAQNSSGANSAADASSSGAGSQDQTQSGQQTGPNNAPAQGQGDQSLPPNTNSQDQSQQPQQQPQQQPTQTNPSSPFGASPMSGGAIGQGTGLLGQIGITQNFDAIAQQKPTGPVDGPVFGAFIAGVGGGNHYDAPSVKYYKGGKKYSEWEFIWNPLEDQARALQSGLSQTGAGAGQQPGTPAGSFGLPIANPNGGASAPGTNPGNGAPPDQGTPPDQQQPPQQEQ